MVELNSDSESSINSDYMLDESENLQMRSRKENKKPMQVVNQNKYQTSNQNEPNLRVNTRGDKKDKNVKFGYLIRMKFCLLSKFI